MISVQWLVSIPKMHKQFAVNKKPDRTETEHKQAELINLANHVPYIHVYEEFDDDDQLVDRQ